MRKAEKEILDNQIIDVFNKLQSIQNIEQDYLNQLGMLIMKRRAD